MAKIDENKLKERIITRLKHYETAYAKARKVQKEDYDYLRGQQWNKDKKEEWKKAGLPTNVNNRIKSKINLLRGEQSKNRTYFKVIPNDEIAENRMPVLWNNTQMILGDVCTIITKELKKIENENDGEYEISDCFLDGIILFLF